MENTITTTEAVQSITINPALQAVIDSGEFTSAEIKKFFTKDGKKKQSTIGRAFLADILQDSDLADLSSKELHDLHGATYASKSGYPAEVSQKRFYSSLSATRKKLGIVIVTKKALKAAAKAEALALASIEVDVAA